MSSPNLFPLVWPTVTAFFTVAQQTKIAQYLSKVNRKDNATKQGVARIFEFIDVATTVAELLVVENLLMQISFGQQPKMFFVNEGEDFALQIDLESGRDFTGFFLTIRQVEGMVLLTANNIAGDSFANAPIQFITTSDLSLAAGNFYKCVALLEHPAGGVASGDAATNLTDLILIVDTDIDI